MDVSRETSPPPEAAAVFGGRLDLARRYVDLLSTDGVVRGLIGPREVPRIWTRHVVNCALPATDLPAGASIADVGSGAGLPGLVWAIMRPDVKITLIEPLLRRTTFLSEVVDELGLSHVEVSRGRAEEIKEQYDIVTSRAVASLGKLVRWSMPLVRPGGQMRAIKGSAAEAEIEESLSTIRAAGGTNPRVASYGEGVVETPTTIVIIDKAG
ncbi:16S rRNA (guanine(527)-N(7))-methyltransferase RsmG [Mumia sp. ZJ1417]|uniref:16S rRNA (guanine(527)-N(7))-methyltransferase RsmG n=1 Tax=Mumia sp. ZJ1417 TaxID=2708082 RepID=UPI00141EF1A0|nr:16S rRNA (guanine(527)-N(7))-methyltransferase RsmG [Mumia sp. ZJ1417]QMW66422.1 16S rRNA (guanine(527)-N(7))-methyltransferase RsmG [Mumia sp. ZJ1417]